MSCAQHSRKFGLDGAAVVVHGRMSHEGQPNSPKRRRLILTRRVKALTPDPNNANARFWNPAGGFARRGLRVRSGDQCAGAALAVTIPGNLGAKSVDPQRRTYGCFSFFAARSPAAFASASHM
jgi:hypothetical protein